MKGEIDDIQKIILVLTALCIAIGSTAGNWVLANAASDTISRRVVFQQPADLFLGKAGVFTPSSAYTGMLELTRIDVDNRHPARNLDFVQRWSEVRMLDPQGARYQRVFSFIYVYFNLDRGMRAAWDTGSPNFN